MPQLKGGLGNQLFQLAFCHSLARRHAARLVINRRQTPWWPLFDLPDVDWPSGRGPDGLLRESAFTVHALPPLPDCRVLAVEGYWQSSRWWREDETHDWLLACPRRTRPEVTLHFRGGDYLRRPDFRRIHDVCGAGYYANALEAVRRDGTDLPVRLVTDDPGAAARASLTMRRTGGLSDFGDLMVMAESEVLVTSNSTFSWWAAWLGRNRGGMRMTVSPDRWFGPDGPDGRDVVPSGWLTVSPDPSPR